MSPPVTLGVESEPTVSDRICEIEGCERRARRRRLRCPACDHAIARYGDPFVRGSRQSKAQRALPDLLVIETDDCVLWPFRVNTDGYGYVTWDGRYQGVHVVACAHHYGPKPTAGHEVAHSCARTRACMNYRHLRWATRSENIADRVAHDTHNRGERQPQHKLTTDDVRRARRLVVEGSSYAAVARLLSVHDVTIHDCVNRRTWAWLDEKVAS